MFWNRPGAFDPLPVLPLRAIKGALFESGVVS